MLCVDLAGSHAHLASEVFALANGEAAAREEFNLGWPALACAVLDCEMRAVLGLDGVDHWKPPYWLQVMLHVLDKNRPHNVARPGSSV
jgi:hypothetical protein